MYTIYFRFDPMRSIGMELEGSLGSAWDQLEVIWQGLIDSARDGR